MLKIGISFKNTLTRKSIAKIIKNSINGILIFESESFKTAVKEINNNYFDLFIIDYKLIVNTYLQIKNIKNNNSHLKMMLFINHEREQSIPIKGISGIIHENINAKKLDKIMKRIEDNEKPFQEDIKINNNEEYGYTDYNQLSTREKQVLTLLSRGNTKCNEIGEILNISKNTVNNHLNNIFKKMSVHNKTHAVIKALKYEIISF